MLHVFSNFKYLGIKIDENLNWIDNVNPFKTLLYDNGLGLDRVNDVAVKLNRANAFYLKSRIL